MWKDIKERYATQNGPRINQLKSEYQTLRQKGMSVVTYYNKFKALWDELYGSDDVTCGCTCAASSKIKDCAEREKTHDFVLGLEDDQYGALRTQILSMEPFPSLNKAFALVTQEARHKTIVRSRDDKAEIVSFAVNSPTPAPRSTNTIPPSPITCTYCGRTGHDYEVCYRRVGFPPGHPRGRGRGRVNGRGRGSSTRRGQSFNVIANAAHTPTLETTQDTTTRASPTSIPGLTRIKSLVFLVCSRFHLLPL
ncbi:Dihydroorotase [Bienertia sinuspersici]